MKIAVFWVVAPCSLVEVYQRFRGPCYLHYQGDEYNPEDSRQRIELLNECKKQTKKEIWNEKRKKE
jgi:hypothetical protein